jgi:hypothetical protein
LCAASVGSVAALPLVGAVADRPLVEEHDIDRRCHRRRERGLRSEAARPLADGRIGASYALDDGGLLSLGRRRPRPQRDVKAIEVLLVLAVLQQRELTAQGEHELAVLPVRLVRQEVAAFVGELLGVLRLRALARAKKTSTTAAASWLSTGHVPLSRTDSAAT